MPDWLADLLFWIVLMVALFFLFRFLQRRKAEKDKGDTE